MLPGATSSVALDTLIGLTRHLTNTKDDVTKYSDTEILAALNNDQKLVQADLISKLMYDWRENTVEGAGNGLITLVSGTNNYAFPTDMLSIDRAEINYTGVTNDYVQIEIRKMQEMIGGIANTSNNEAIMGSKGSPIIWIRNGRLYIDPVPDLAVTGGLKVWATILLTDLTVGGTAPVFASPFHQILAYDAAILYLVANEENKKLQTVSAFRNGIFNQMIEFYSTRESDGAETLEPAFRSYR